MSQEALARDNTTATGIAAIYLEYMNILTCTFHSHETFNSYLELFLKIYFLKCHLLLLSAFLFCLPKDIYSLRVYFTKIKYFFVYLFKLHLPGCCSCQIIKSLYQANTFNLLICKSYNTTEPHYEMICLHRGCLLHQSISLCSFYNWYIRNTVWIRAKELSSQPNLITGTMLLPKEPHAFLCALGMVGISKRRLEIQIHMNYEQLFWQ